MRCTFVTRRTGMTPEEFAATIKQVLQARVIVDDYDMGWTQAINAVARYIQDNVAHVDLKDNDVNEVNS